MQHIHTNIFVLFKIHAIKYNSLVGWVRAPSGLATAFQFCEQSWWSSSLLSAGIHGLMSIPPPSAHDPAGHSVSEDIHSYYTSLGIFPYLQWTLWLTSMGEALASHLSTPGRSF